MVPLSVLEIGELSLERTMVSGLLPSHFLSDDPREELRAYVGDYLREEIAAEALTRSIPAFAEFLRVAALTSSELVNYTNVARETGVSAIVCTSAGPRPSAGRAGAPYSPLAMTARSPAPAFPAARGRTRLWQALLPWLVTAACFAYLYTRLAGAAAREGTDLAAYLGGIFARVPWGTWLALMVPYSVFFFLVDSLVVWRIINWFNARVRYADILPIRGSAYIISMLNEQVGKGVMAFYLNRRDGVPGWEVGSSMLFIMFCEFYYLLAWATLGVALRGDRLPAVFQAVPWLAALALAFFVLWTLYFRGVIAPGWRLRERPILLAFRKARPWQYGAVILLRSPAMLGAVVVYTLALRLFGVEAAFADMLGYLPVVFFGAATPGPMRSVAILLWVTLFPDHAGEMTAFGFVQHNFFILFNAAIGVLFLRRANRELFAPGRAAAAS
jgi:hypothetical protein